MFGFTMQWLIDTVKSQVWSDLNSRVRAERVNALNIPAGPPTHVIFDSVTFDGKSEYNPSTGFFTCIKDGYYLVNANVTLNPGAGALLGFAYIFKNLVVASSIQVGKTPAVADLALNLSTLVFLVAGDTLSCRCGHFAGSPIPLRISPGYNCFCVQRVGD